MVKSHGFRLSLIAFGRASAGAGASLSSLWIVLNKHSGSGAGSSYQATAYRFNRGIAFTASHNLGTAHVAGELLRRRGAARLSFRATGPGEPVPLPKGCSGAPGQKRHGVLRGSLLLRADRLGTVTLHTIGATLKVPPTIFECRGGGTHGSHRHHSRGQR